MARIPLFPDIHNKAKAMEAFVENCMVQGLSTTKIQTLASQEYAVSRSTIARLVSYIGDRWIKEEEDRRPLYKSAAMERLARYSRKAAEEKNWSAVARFESLLADMQGTKEPIRIQVTAQVTTAMLNIIGNMSTDDIRTIEDQMRELESNSKPTLLLSESNDVIRQGSQEVSNGKAKPNGVH